MKKTAVDWLAKNLKDFPHIKHSQSFKELIKQAKEMEKGQIIDASYYGHLKGWVDDGVENSYGEQYYNQTFKAE